MEFPKGIKEIACRISAQARPRKNYVEFPGSWFLVLEFPRDVTQFRTISRDGAICLGFPGVK